METFLGGAPTDGRCKLQVTGWRLQVAGQDFDLNVEGVG